jgi:hypothetical protein
MGSVTTTLIKQITLFCWKMKIWSFLFFIIFMNPENDLVDFITLTVKNIALCFEKSGAEDNDFLSLV